MSPLTSERNHQIGKLFFYGPSVPGSADPLSGPVLSRGRRLVEMLGNSVLEDAGKGLLRAAMQRLQLVTAQPLPPALCIRNTSYTLRPCHDLVAMCWRTQGTVLTA